MNKLTFNCGIGALLFLTSSVASAQIAVDGVKGAEWSGFTPKSVSYSASAATGNFGTPSNVSETVAYDIYLRSDMNYVYGLLETKPAGSGLDSYDPGLLFTNLYFSTNPFGYAGSASGTIGFELLNDRAFKPGVAGYLPGTLSSLGFVTATTPGTTYANGGSASIIEFAMPWSYFYGDPQSAPFAPITPTNFALRLNLSQSFGYAVAGGQTSYGNDRLGVVFNPVPEPASMAAVGLGAVALLRKRKKN